MCATRGPVRLGAARRGCPGSYRDTACTVKESYVGVSEGLPTEHPAPEPFGAFAVEVRLQPLHPLEGIPVQFGLPQHEPLVEAGDGIRVLFDEVVEFHLAAQHLEVLT